MVVQVVILIFEGILQEMLIWKVIETVLLADFYLLFFSVWQKRSFAPSTPLTGRRYLREKEAVITPVASATQSVSRLQSMVAGLKNAPSEQLTAIFEWVWPLQLLSLTQKLIFWLFFSSEQNNLVCVSVLFLVEGSSVFWMISSGEGWLYTHTPIWLVTTIVLMELQLLLMLIHLFVCLKAKCLFCLFTF